MLRGDLPWYRSSECTVQRISRIYAGDQRAATAEERGDYNDNFQCRDSGFDARREFGIFINARRKMKFIAQYVYTTTLCTVRNEMTR